MLWETAAVCVEVVEVFAGASCEVDDTVAFGEVDGVVEF